ncbi:uncharacterized protein N0V89_002455 [Didymosphaeria variabile]|uniref:Uncharacterized protein n=1 Tax=Didymosphaeria variabile TaxID=1932322 RepID=A0A9W9CEN8_9PLEO|nr:uncharacterized protein N0V89_002455 [Didymosphaeria variabile]KAJ4357878.1 hypothetical protein N0V89_002455 [Didymosphaeria variabile]
MPALQHQKSHYLLPLNSTIFKSKSSTNLPSTNQRNIFAKSTTTLAHNPIEEPDEELTALPPPPAPAKPIPRKPNTQELVPSTVRVQGAAENPEDAPHQALRCSRSMGDLEGGDVEAGDEKRKESVWRRLFEALKKPFRKEKEPVEKPRELVIGGPTDFKHIKTGTACLPSQPAPQIEDDEGDTSGDWETMRPSESTVRASESFLH